MCSHCELSGRYEVEMIVSLIGESKNVAHLMINLPINVLLKPSLPSGTSALKNFHLVLGEFCHLCFQAEGLDINPLVPPHYYIFRLLFSGTLRWEYCYKHYFLKGKHSLVCELCA